MSVRYHLNLASRPFRPLRAIRLGLGVILAVVLAWTASLVYGFAGYTRELADLRRQVRSAEVEWQSVGEEIATIEARLGRADIADQVEELRFLNQTFERKRLSWDLLLRELERVIPADAYLVSLSPGFTDQGTVALEIEMRGETVDALTRFLANLESSAAFEDVAVFLEEQGEVDGRIERRMLTAVEYLPSQAVQEVAAQ